MEMDAAGWIVTALAILLTGISKAGLGGGLGGLAVPFMAMWISPRDAVAVMLPILIAMDFAGMRAWRGQADWNDLRRLVPAALLGIGAGALVFDQLSERMVKLVLGLIALGFAAERLLRSGRRAIAGQSRALPPSFAWLCGAGAGFTSTLAHSGGPPLMAYLLNRDLPRQTFVATSVFFFTAINLAKLPFYLAIDLFSRATMWMSMLLLPLVPLGVWLGLRLIERVPERPFHLFASWALGLSGAKLTLDALLG